MKKKDIKCPLTVSRSLRLPAELWEKIKKSATLNRRTANAELVVWLEKVK